MKVAILSKGIYKFNMILIKTSTLSFTEKNLNLKKIHITTETTQNS